MDQPILPAASPAPATPTLSARGRPRSERAHQAILEATRELLLDSGYAGLRLEHVAARAGVSKATIYRRWASREELVLELVTGLIAPRLGVDDLGDTRAELIRAVVDPITTLATTPFGPIIRTLLSEVAGPGELGERFRATVVATRRATVEGIVRHGIERGDLRPDVDVTLATELLVGPVYYRFLFGGQLDRDVAERIVDAYLAGASIPDVDWV